MNSSITIRKSTEDDYDQIFAMHEEWFKAEIEERWGWNDLWQKQNFSEEWKRDVFEVILDHDKIIGYAQKTIESDYVYLQSIGLAPAFRGKGIGRKVMEDLLEDASGDFSLFRLSVGVSNFPAIKLYESLDFEVESRSEYSLTMRKDLTKLVK